MTSALLLTLTALAAAWLLPAAGRVLGRASARTPRLALLALAGAATIYGGSKSRVGTVSFPRTDPLVAYLSDAGSYVTNDFVHVAFTRVVVPDSAGLFIDRRAVSSTNDADWVTHIATTFEQFQPPQDVQFTAASNWNWAVYTDWTPGPAVETNGVWHAMFGIDRRSGRHVIPVRACIRVDADVIATPKSKEDNR